MAAFPIDNRRWEVQEAESGIRAERHLEQRGMGRNAFQNAA